MSNHLSNHAPIAEELDVSTMRPLAKGIQPIVDKAVACSFKARIPSRASRGSGCPDVHKRQMVESRHHGPVVWAVVDESFGGKALDRRTHWVLVR